MLLKYAAAAWQAAAPAIVIFAIYEGDLNRALTRYYPFYSPESKQYLGFKPRFELDQGLRLRLIASPKTGPVRDRAQLRRLIDQAREHDVWYERRVEIGFPYTWQLLKLARLLREPAFGRAWESPRVTALLRSIIERFAAVARQRGHLGVLLFIPRVPSWEHGRGEPPYRAFVDELRSERPDLLTSDVAEASFEPARFNILPFEGHASVYGNQIIARHIATVPGGLIARPTEAQATRAPAGLAPMPR
jgi:hypothetical protein